MSETTGEGQDTELSERSAYDMADERDVDAIVDALEANEKVSKVVRQPAELEITNSIAVTIGGLTPSTRAIEDVYRNHDLQFGYAYVTADGRLRVSLHAERGGENA